MRKLIILIAFMCAAYLYPQSSGEINTNPAIPPSPTAFKFSNYGNIPLNGSTGGFSYSIPVYTIVDKDITLPVSLDYYSNGVKTDDLAGITGTGWILTAGGVISRIKRGLPDEEYERWYPEDIHHGTPEIDSKIYAVVHVANSIDVERDWFSFNVNGISGNFYFDENLQVHADCKENVKITYDRPYFTITDSQGYQYKFNIVETTRSSAIFGTGPHSDEREYISGWFLSEIISPRQNKVSISYIENQFTFIPGISYRLIYENSYEYPQVLTPNLSETILQNIVRSVAISKITFSNNSIDFNYDSGRPDQGGLLLKEISINAGNQNRQKIELNYETTVASNLDNPLTNIQNDLSLRYRLFLKNVSFKKTDGVKDYQLSFNYYQKDQLPGRLSISKDKYGYANGSVNSRPFSSKLLEYTVLYPLQSIRSYATGNTEVNPNTVYYGMLSTIEYPTGGYTQITYEANSNTVPETEIQESYESLYVAKGGGTYEPSSRTFRFVSNGSVIGFSANGSLHPEDTPDIHDQYRVSIKNKSTNQELFNRSGLFGENLATKGHGNNSYDVDPVTTVAGNEYEITISLESIDPNRTSAHLEVWYNGHTVAIDKPVYAGGARVKEIYDATDGKRYNKRTFYYNRLSEYPSLRTSLVDMLNPVYYKETTYRKSTYDTGCSLINIYLAHRISISSDAISDTYNNRKQVSYYTSITEFMETGEGNNGAKEYFFYDIPGSSTVNVIKEPDIIEGPRSSPEDSYYGLLVQENTYRRVSGNYILASSKKYEYTALASEYLSSFIFQEANPLPYCKTSISDIENISGVRYFNWIKRLKCTTQTETLYDSSSPVITTTVNTYGNPPYFNLTAQRVSSSEGGSQVSNYQYAPDLAGQLPYMGDLVAGYRVGIPIITQKKKVSAGSLETLVSYMKTTYENFPIEQHDGTIKRMVLPQYVFYPVTDDQRVSYERYDEYGNVAFMSKDGVDQVVYLWSYSGQYPIAEIKNATFTEAEIAAKAVFSVASADALSALTTPNEAKLKDGSLQKALPDALVTTYTYKPLVGMLTATDPSGITTYYEYDDSGRLKRTGDADGKTIQQYGYHYKGDASTPLVDPPISGNNTIQFTDIQINNTTGVATAKISLSKSQTITFKAELFGAPPRARVANVAIAGCSATFTIGNESFSLSGNRNETKTIEKIITLGAGIHYVGISSRILMGDIIGVYASIEIISVNDQEAEIGNDKSVSVYMMK